MIVHSLALSITALIGVQAAPANETLQAVQAWGAVGDGVADDTQAIQKAVDAGVGDLYFPRGTYRVTQPIQVELDKTGPIGLVANGPARIAVDHSGPAIRFVGTHRGTAGPSTFEDRVWERQRTPRVTGLEFVGVDSRATAIQATGTMQLTVTAVVIRKMHHGIHLVNRNRNVLIADCHIYENEGVGIFYDQVNLHQSNIIGCHVSYNSGGGIVIRGGDVRNVHIGTCDIEGNMGGTGSDPTANVLFDSTGGSIGEAAIVGCTIQHAHDAPDSANIRINGESTRRPFTSETRHGNITIADNVLSDVQTNLDIANTRGVSITGNTIWKGYRRNLSVRNSDSVVVANNVFDRNPRYHYGDGSQARNGIQFTDCDGCTFQGNQVVGGKQAEAAVIFRDSRRLNITANTILESARCGLLLDNVTASRVSDCLIHGTLPLGEAGPISLRAVRCHGNMFVQNLLADPSEISGEDNFVSGNYAGQAE